MEGGSDLRPNALAWAITAVICGGVPTKAVADEPGADVAGSYASSMQLATATTTTRGGSPPGPSMSLTFGALLEKSEAATADSMCEEAPRRFAQVSITSWAAHGSCSMAMNTSHPLRRYCSVVFGWAITKVGT